MDTKFTMGLPTLPLTGFKLSPIVSSTPLLGGSPSGLDLLSGCALPAVALPPQYAGTSSSSPCLPPLASFLAPLPAHYPMPQQFPPRQAAVPIQLSPQNQHDLLSLLSYSSSPTLAAAPSQATSASIILQKAAVLAQKELHAGSNYSEGISTEDDTDSHSHSDEEDEEDEEGEDSEEGEAARASDLLHPDSKDRGSSSTSSPVLVSQHVESVKLPGRRGRRPKPPHERRHKCTMCNRDFKRMEHLKRHLRVHTGEKPFSCPLPGCPKYFSRQDNLTQHIKTHKNRAERGSLGHCSEDGDDQ